MGSNENSNAVATNSKRRVRVEILFSSISQKKKKRDIQEHEYGHHKVIMKERFINTRVYK